MPGTRLANCARTGGQGRARGEYRGQGISRAGVGGVVETRGQYGTFVARADPADAAMAAAAHSFAEAARALGSARPTPARYLDTAFD